MTYASVVASKNAQAHYRLGESSGTTMVDVLNARSGTYFGSPTLGTTGALVGDSDTAVTFLFAGTRGQVNYASWMNVSSLTVSCWFKTTNSGTMSLVDRDASSTANRPWQFRMDAGKVQFLRVKNAAGTVDVIGSQTPLTYHNGVWHHAVFTYDGTTAKVYVDGALKVTTTIAGGLQQPAGADLCVGAHGSSSAQAFDGPIDEVSYHDVALSATDVLDIYTAGTTAPSTNVTISGTLQPKTASFAVATVLAATLAGTLQAKTAQFDLDAVEAVGNISLVGELPRKTAAFGMLVSAQATLAGTLQPKTGAFSLTAVAVADRTVALAGSLRRKTSAITLVSNPAVRIAASLRPKTAAFAIDAQPTVTLAGELQRKVGTFTTYAVTPVTPAPLPPEGAAVVAASAFGAVAMQGSQAVYAVSTATTPRARQQIVADGVDITYFRGVTTPDVTYTLREPLLYGPGSLELPQVSACFEEPGAGALSFLRPGASVQVHLVVDDVVVHRDIYKGVVLAHDTSGRNLSVELGGEAAGRAAIRDEQVPIFKRVNDIGRQVHGAIRDLGLPMEPYLGPVTGIETMTTGGTGLLEHIDALLAKAWTRAGRQWTVMPDEHGVYRMNRKDDTTIHGTVFVDDARTVANLRRDVAEEPKRIFVTCVTPAGQRVRFGVYPGLIQGPVPDFPGHMEEGDSGDGVRLLIGRLHAVGYISLSDTGGGYDNDVVKGVKKLQNDAGLSQTGEVNEATWNALYDLDVTSSSLQWAHVEPAAQRSKVRPFNRSGTGTIMGLNPDHEPEELVSDRTIDLGSGVTRNQAAEFALTVLHDSDDPNWIGSITFHAGALVRGDGFQGMTVTEADVMDARELRPGMNLDLPQFAGGIFVHISAIEVDGEGIVTATVDTRFRSAMEVWEIIARNKESRNDPSRSRNRKHRSSTIVKDSIGEWDEIGGYNGNDIPLEPGWNKFEIVAAAEGTISRFRYELDTPAESACVVFGDNVDVGWLNNNFPKPLTNFGGKQWENKAGELDDRNILYSAGTKAEPCGYSPGRKTEIEYDEDTDEETSTTFNAPTGLHVDKSGFAYRSETRTLLYVFVWVAAENKIPVQRIMWPQLESGA